MGLRMRLRRSLRLFLPMGVFSALLGSVFLGWTPPATAFSGADTPDQWRVSAGTGPSVATEIPVVEHLSLGLGAASPLLFNGTLDRARYSGFINYQVLNQNGFYISGILGVYGDYVFADPALSSRVSVQGGAALAYDLNRSLSLRLNIVPGFALQLPPRGWTFLSPVGGAAVIWRPTPGTELAVGLNGFGDIANFSWVF